MSLLPCAIGKSELMTRIQPSNAPAPNTRICQAYAWRVLGWVNATYCLFALIVAALYLYSFVTADGDVVYDVDWSAVPVQAQPFVSLSTRWPLWLPLAIFPLTAIAAVGCFREEADYHRTEGPDEHRERGSAESKTKQMMRKQDAERKDKAVLLFPTTYYLLFRNNQWKLN